MLKNAHVLCNIYILFIYNALCYFWFPKNNVFSFEVVHCEIVAETNKRNQTKPNTSLFEVLT